MLDIKWIVKNPKLFNESMRKKGLEIDADYLIDLYKTRTESLSKLQELQSQRNTVAKQIGIIKSQGGDATELLQKSKFINVEIANLEKCEESDELHQALIRLPNILQEDVPVGEDDNDNREIFRWGEPRKFDFEPKQHFDIGEGLGLMDFEHTSKVSGARFTTLFGALAKLERAVADFMLDTVLSHGHTEVSPPFMVRTEAAFGAGQLPKFAEDFFKTTDDRWLISTAEIPLTAHAMGRIFEEKDLPIRLCAYTPCFRSEAGSAGKDTRGMLRQHQFKKVEMVCMTAPNQSNVEHERMAAIEEEILQKLGLPYRKMVLCSGDTGISSSKTYDMEVWLPGQNTYREISSCSNCTDYQARRMKGRYRPTGSKKPEFIHTLNGSALAVGRTMIAIMENYQNEDGSFDVPEVLVPYMNGLTKVCKGK